MWLHSETQYTYHGDAPLTGLTQFELDKLQLGWIVRQEQRDEAGGSRPGRSHSATRAATRRRAHELARERAN